MKRRFQSLFFILAILAGASVSAAPPSAKERADQLYAGYPNIVRDLQYHSVPGFAQAEQLSMDLILPTGRKPADGAPVVIYIHGGGWSGGERYVLAPQTFNAYSKKGIAVACISYRLAKGGNSALDCLIDCKDATRFLAKNSAKYGLDPNRFATTGHSAGGHLTLLTALVPNDHPLLKGDPELQGSAAKFVCAAALAPQVALLHPERFDSPATITMKADALEKIIGGKSPRQPAPGELATDEGRAAFIGSIAARHSAMEIAKTLSPGCWLKSDSPPLLVVHGSADTLISVRGSRAFKELGDGRGARVEYVEVANGRHNFKSEETAKPASHTPEQVDALSREFLINHLINSR